MSASADLPTTSWRWWLCESSTMAQIDEVDVYSKQHTPQLNAAGKATGWMHLLDPKSALVQIHKTCLRLDRNNETVWSGPIFQSNESTAATAGNQSGQDQLAITAMGWFQNLNQRQLHTGAEFQAMLAAPNGQAWQATNGTYLELGTDIATTLSYSATGNPLTTDAAIIFDLLGRANIDAPTGITPGVIYGAPAQRNLTLNQFQNVGDEITNLLNTEDGCDMYIDPVTRQMNLYGNGASPSPTIPQGLGLDRGSGCLFTLPGNCISASRTKDGTQTANRDEVSGQYGVGRADDTVSQADIGLYEVNDSLSDATDINILISYAQVEVAVRSYPWTIITFNPRGLTRDDIDPGPSGVPRPYVDYLIGDIVYAQIARGSFVVGAPGAPQATRVFGWTVNIDDSNSVEKISSVQTTYSGAGS